MRHRPDVGGLAGGGGLGGRWAVFRSLHVAYAKKARG